jgi:predicted  nucleic acid-binding Zn-ribbon protein
MEILSQYIFPIVGAALTGYIGVRVGQATLQAEVRTLKERVQQLEKEQRDMEQKLFNELSALRQDLAHLKGMLSEFFRHQPKA